MSSTRMFNSVSPLTQKTGVTPWLIAFLTTVFFSAAFSNIAAPLWKGDPAQGIKVFKQINTPDENSASKVTVVSDPEAGQVFQVTKVAADLMCEAQGGVGVKPEIGLSYFVSFKFKLPSTAGNTSIFRWKAFGSGTNMAQNYPIALRCVDGDLTLIQYRSAEDRTQKILFWEPVKADQWYTNVVLVHVSDKATDGYVEYWFNGTHQNLLTGGPRFKCQTFDGERVEPKWGLVSKHPKDQIIYFGDLKIANSLSDLLDGVPAKIPISTNAVQTSAFSHSYPAWLSVDGDMKTHWAAKGDNVWIQYDLGEPKTVTSIKLALFQADDRIYTFDLQAADDADGPWNAIQTGVESQRSANLVPYDIKPTKARYIRFVGHSNTHDDYNNINETEIWGF